ncbi:MAG TPA: hypothetical protein VHF26_26190 [Trebonia sp.]|nr:hypothetical protein [Trebonia sp.]
MFVHALSGAAAFAACLRLFRSFPLAVNHHFADSAGPGSGPPAEQGRKGEGAAAPRRSGGLYRSILLRHRGAGEAEYHLLTQDPAGRFTLRPWHPAVGQGQQVRCQEISPGAPVPVTSHLVITEGMPVPRHGALLGWVSDRQATVLLAVHHGQPGDGRCPQIRVLPLVGSEPVRWPPFTASPLADGRLWEYVERDEIVDLAPAVVRGAGGAFWVPSQNRGRADAGHGCVVVARSLEAEEYWVPPGVYMDHWMLREGVPAPPASHLLGLPGTTDLSRRLTGR